MSNETIPVDPTTGHPIAGDTVLYTASNDAVFGGTVEESHADRHDASFHRFRIVGHEGLFLHESEEWQRRVISRPVPVFEPGTVGLATVLDGEEERQTRGAWVQGKGGIYFAPFVAGASGRNMFYGDTMLNFVPDEARPQVTQGELAKVIQADTAAADEFGDVYQISPDAAAGRVLALLLGESR
jgi:hypothetical protein